MLGCVPGVCGVPPDPSGLPQPAAKDKDKDNDSDKDNGRPSAGRAKRRV